MRNGKIARLPHKIREQLNRRLQDGEQSDSILPWLNSLPQVKSTLEAHFESRPINKVNLTEWRNGGYHDWVLSQQALDFTSQFETPASQPGQDADERLNQSIPEKLAHWVALQYVVTARPLLAAEQDLQRKWALLRELCTDVLRLRRSDLLSERFRLKIQLFHHDLEKEHASHCAALQKQADKATFFNRFLAAAAATPPASQAISSSPAAVPSTPDVSDQRQSSTTTPRNLPDVSSLPTEPASAASNNHSRPNPPSAPPSSPPYIKPS